MNLHPVFVHFPIAFLTLYAGLELLRLKRLTDLPYWFYIKAVLVIAGSLGSLVARQTGETAARGLENDSVLHNIIEKHELFANLSVFTFGILAACYLVQWIYKDTRLKETQNKFCKFCFGISNWVLGTPISFFLALTGLAVLTITGGLGGAMVYGPKADPFFEPVYNLLVK